MSERMRVNRRDMAEAAVTKVIAAYGSMEKARMVSIAIEAGAEPMRLARIVGVTKQRISKMKQEGDALRGVER